MSIAVRQQPAPGRDHLPWLDGLRGAAALWVLLSHVLILTGSPSVPVLSWGGLAVELFMMLSGFLMAHHYILRRAPEPWEQPQTFAIFWLRRFFRIAPLYYVLLAAALVLGPWLGENRAAIAQLWPATATAAERYNDAGAQNILAHASFVFGALPRFSFRTALPDWSIGLEMQFYLVFPVLMLGFARLGPARAGVLAVLACIALRLAFGDFFRQFEMPSFLPMKLYLFVIGMWIATARRDGSLRRAFFVSLALAVFFVAVEKSPESLARIGLIGTMYYLMDDGMLPAGRLLRAGIGKARVQLSRPLCRFVGDTSYGTYLVHLLVVLPVAGALARIPGYGAAPAALRFFACLLICLPVVYALAWILYRQVEQRGIRFGKAVVGGFKGRIVLE